MTGFTTAGILLLVMQAMNALGQEKPTPKETKGVSVALTLSVEEYDPSTPSKAVIKCVVRNDTDGAIQVPASYDGEHVRLESGKSVLNRIEKGKDELKLVRIEPAKEHVVFELPLDQILLLGKTKDSALGWDWPDWTLRLAPPKSPIYRKVGGRDVLVAEASFAARLKIGGQTLVSNIAHLKVKETKVSVGLSLSVEEYDPSTTSKAMIKCVVRNDTGDAVQVPASYDGKRIRLESTSGLVLNRIKEDDIDRLEHRITALKGKLTASDDPDSIVALAHDLADAVKTKQEKESQALIRIEPGKERVVFEFPLDEILLPGIKVDRVFGWGWGRRPRPPKSPIYLEFGSRNLVAESSFAVRLIIGGQIVDSKYVRLKVKSSD